MDDLEALRILTNPEKYKGDPIYIEAKFTIRKLIEKNKLNSTENFQMKKEENHKRFDDLYWETFTIPQHVGLGIQCIEKLKKDTLTNQDTDISSGEALQHMEGYLKELIGFEKQFNSKSPATSYIKKVISDLQQLKTIKSDLKYLSNIGVDCFYLPTGNMVIGIDMGDRPSQTATSIEMIKEIFARGFRRHV